MKKVLIVSYYWPPSGGISVLRSLKISKYLKDYGWEPVVLTVKNPQYSIIDEDNARHIPDGITVLKSKAIEPFKFYKSITGKKKQDTLSNVLNANDKKGGVLHKLSVWIRANYFIPDARSLWIKSAIKEADKYLKENDIDAIFSDGPPHTNTLIAKRISKKHSIPWLMDWQDPWTEVDYYKLFPIGKKADRKHKRLEAECFEQASKMTIVSPTWKKDAEKLGAKNVSVVVWGYDEDDFDGIEPVLTGKFLITHTGLLGSDRNPTGFIDALSKLIDELPTFKNDLLVRFYGTVDRSVSDYITKNGLSENFEIKNHVPRKVALSNNLGSSIQLLLLNKAHNVMGRVPGKLFEYLHTNRPILCCGPPDSDVGKIIDESKAGITIDYDNESDIKKYIQERYERYQNNDETNLTEGIDKYNIKTLTGEIAGYLNEITE